VVAAVSRNFVPEVLPFMATMERRLTFAGSLAEWAEWTKDRLAGCSDTVNEECTSTAAVLAAQRCGWDVFVGRSAGGQHYHMRRMEG
jgi:hypothetical protein